MFDFLYLHLDTLERLALVAIVVAGAHLAVRMVRGASERLMARSLDRSYSKARTVNSLATSILVFCLYFGALGWGLSELGVPLTAYFASASIIGLAVAFGSQGIVQDVMTGLTVLLSGQFDVGDMVQIGDQAGIVQKIGMRFTVLQNAMGAQVIIPNRSIGNVTNYPRGYVRIAADVTLPAAPERAAEAEAVTRAVTASVSEQFAGIFRAPSEFVGRFTTSSGRTYFRVKFRIWPGRGGPVETAFKQELMQALKKIDPDYADWMVSVTYEVEKPLPPTRKGRR
ncbi:mechanosensitive ion channel family protein [Oceanibacterium hippocampi]|uniref:Putative MscS family protein YkuT n=1 Tax=Oceanibacterium hippocampi TaxID=745714 RepID=A0A1Y5SFH9_9PROT|nr:mechanosensitive ion channel domain-containing protein [Oceanibacterium hippocampi]SLN39523.1 putative MscS family protein YkuT [Oceanibacterium hippocampi]